MLRNSEEWQEWIAFGKSRAEEGWSAMQVLDLLEERRKWVTEFQLWRARQPWARPTTPPPVEVVP